MALAPDRANPSSLVLVAQPFHAAIAEGQMLDALTPDENARPRRVAEIDTKAACESAIATGDWVPVEQAVRTEFESKLRPLLDGDAEAALHYFGTAPIPAAMLLGFLVGSWARIAPHLRHHLGLDWKWPSRVPGSPSPVLRPSRRPSGERVLAEGDIIVRVATSIAVDVSSTREIVPKPLAEFDLALEALSLDAFASSDEIEMVARDFRALLDEIVQVYPGATTIHVFAAVPVGLAFCMGTLVSPTMHPTVQTYYFDRKARPQQIPAIALQARRDAATTLTEDDRTSARELRDAWASEAQRISRYAALLAERARNEKLVSWLDFVLPAGSDAKEAFGGRWLELVPLHDTNLAASTVDTSVTDVPGDFDYLAARRAWVFGDGLLVALAKRLADDASRRRAGRMLLFHEGVHLAAQTVTRQTSNQVGRFPKVLEIIDYYADVWAMLNEYAMARDSLDPDATDARAFILRLIATATETFWAFDAGNGPLHELQVRRMNRYLLWYWQQLRVEHEHDDPSRVFAILADQPVIELAGPRLHARNGRVWYSLAARDVQSLELAVLHRGALHRHATGPATDLSLVLEGFRARNGELVKEGLRGIYAQTVRE